MRGSAEGRGAEPGTQEGVRKVTTVPRGNSNSVHGSGAAEQVRVQSGGGSGPPPHTHTHSPGPKDQTVFI